MNVKILKETTRKPMGPFGDVDVKNDDSKKDKKNKEALKSDQAGGNKCKKGVRQHSVDRQDKQKNDNIRIIQEYERKERERRERFEREAAEAERNQREEEFARWERERRKEKSKNSSSLSRHKPRKPPAGYKDPHEVCKQVLPTKVKEKKRQEMRALMNCIAFTPSQTNLRTTSEGSQAQSEEKKKTAVDDMDTSSGSDSTSITDVTPRSSSSGCSSMSKQSMCVDKPERGKLEETSAGKLTDENKLKRETELGGVRSGGCKSLDGDVGKSAGGQAEPEARKLTEAELEEMKYMQDAFEDLDLDEETSDFASSIISGLSEERRAKCNRKNMTFTNEQLREIERVNLILLKKIMNHRKPKVKPAACPPPANRRTSAAINRSRMEEKIERENKILLKKLQSAKGTTGTLSRKNSQSRCY